MARAYYVYILGNSRPTLYIGTSSNLARRIWQHQSGVVGGFTRRYRIHKLLYYEIYATPQEAIYREKCLKRWKREWKLELIQKSNPLLKDLSHLLGS